MALTSVQQSCGDAVCSGIETYSTCSVDCSPQTMDYINCVIEKGVCSIDWVDQYGTKILFILFIILILYFMKSRKRL